MSVIKIQLGEKDKIENFKGENMILFPKFYVTRGRRQ